MPRVKTKQHQPLAASNAIKSRNDTIAAGGSHNLTVELQSFRHTHRSVTVSHT
jgi:hypothetical protein